jgi:maltose alpha-D-glucosyltransferase/alpha-amylase
VARAKIGTYLDMAALLGRRTAQMHLVLASAPDDPAFAPEGFSKLYQRGLYQSMRSSARKSLDLLRKQFAQLPSAIQPLARTLLDRQSDVLTRFGELLKTPIVALRIRCHGDYHLGQVLFTGKDFLIIDFEGEPDRPVSERRIKRAALRDVAGMIRSFHYASHSALQRHAPGLVPQREGAVSPEQWVQFWYAWVASGFLKAYLMEASSGSFLPTNRVALDTLLRTLLLEKAVYELSYELNNRPDWVKIPLEGILGLLE